jgi:hypothetical protein
VAVYGVPRAKYLRTPLGIGPLLGPLSMRSRFAGFSFKLNPVEGLGAIVEEWAKRRQIPWRSVVE